MWMAARGSALPPVNVLHIYKGYFPDTVGGVGEVIRQIALGQRAGGVRSRILCLGHVRRPEVLDVTEGRIFRFPISIDMASSPLSWRALRAWPGHLRWADLVHYHFPWPFADVLHLASAVRRPSVLTYHADIVRQRWLYPLYRPLMRRFLASVDAVVATSAPYLASSEVLQRLPVRPRVIPLGLDETTLPEPDAAALSDARRRFGQDFILFVGALRYYKGLDDLLTAAAGLAMPILIAGGGNESAHLARRVTTEGLAHVRLLGPVTDADKACLLRLCRAFVFPSHLRSEAFGVSLLEAARFAKPMISCEIGTGTSFVNVDGQTGLVVPPTNPSALARAISLLHRDPALAIRLGQGARRRFEALFTADRMAAAYLGLYRELAPG